ncbi:MAG: PDR/VanB family oxidoreductase [Kerstersia gyiorum]|jgi:vanillate O-demethylase ferredoxin subunit|uniref:PDR/VanB family oxidoreductase n=1 Tax=Kerstersia gyiorum TaxID=206506 RepID=UPI00242D7155|nr:PDR/VanB family oxidoreductase [Kerstersia gyiorum]MCH4270451.1 PDR/VanB family oxidoreductase [Kerstersia gyiorum]
MKTHDSTPIPAVVAGIADLTPTIREFLIQPQDGAVIEHEPGAHLPVQAMVPNADGLLQPQLRHYSLVGEPDAAGYRIAVKRQDDGRGGSLSMWRLETGDRLSVFSPANHFPLDLNAGSYLLAAGGIGITPLVFMAQRLQARGASLQMIYSARSAQELAYAQLLRGQLGDALQLHDGSSAALPDYAAAIRQLPADGLMYTCGPAPMLEALKRCWAESGRPLANLRFETFGSSGSHPAQAFTVRIPRHDMEVTVPVGASLLDTLEAAGVATISDCRRGECGLCAMDVLGVEGVIDHRDVFLSEEEKHSNTRLCACVSRVVGNISLDTAYRVDTLPMPA